jgi:hypothetical protein
MDPGSTDSIWLSPESSTLVGSKLLSVMATRINSFTCTAPKVWKQLTQMRKSPQGAPSMFTGIRLRET